MGFSKIFLTLILFIMMVSIAYGQRETGSIRGVVVDPEGGPLPGVTVTATSPAMLGTVSYVTSVSGEFRAPALPPGTYTVTAQLQGFKTVKREGVIVHVGMTVEVNIHMEPSAISEEVTVTAPSPVVDVVSSKITQTFSMEVVRNIPVAREVWNIVALAPGVVAPTSGIRVDTSLQVHGSNTDQNQFKIDGVSMMDNVYNYPGSNISYDAMEEIEMITGGLPAEYGQLSGMFVNVVSKSGGNKFSGAGMLYYTNEDLTEILFSDTQLRAMKIAKPVAPVSNIETEATLGGPIFKDRLWFFSSFNWLRYKYHSAFIPVTFLGKYYGPYNTQDTNWKAFSKFTGQISQSIKLQAMIHADSSFRPYGGSFGGGTYTPIEVTQGYDRKTYNLTSNLQWIINPDTFLNIRVGNFLRTFSNLQQPGQENSVRILDQYTGYSFGHAYASQTEKRNSWIGSVNLVRFQDNLLGGSHEFKAGIEFESFLARISYWGEPLSWNYYNENPYYYRGLYGLKGPHPTYGDGWLTFLASLAPGKDQGSLNSRYVRYSGFIQDSWTIKKRLTINYGARYDYYDSWCPAAELGALAGLAYDIGEYYFKPTIGFNPYGYKKMEKWDHVMQWGILSPRVGIVYDLFGNGKTALKASYAKLSHPLTSSDFDSLHPFQDHYYDFRWWDLNNNGVPDSPPIDRYDHFGSSPVEMFVYKELMSPDIPSPYYSEIIASLRHELMKDVSIGFSYIHKDAKKFYGSALYDRISGRYWYTYDQAKDWWVPFTTTIPGLDVYPAQKATMYFPSNDAPPQTVRTRTIPEAVNKYNGLEFTIDKRMSNGWQLSGSVVLSKGEGNTAGTAGGLYSSDFRNPNVTVNNLGRIANDRPLVIKLFGTFNFPFRILGSFSYIYSSGSPLARSVTVVPPAAWAAANNVLPNSYAIKTEVSGTRRDLAFSNLDFRIEKEFGFGKYGKFGVFLDVFNLLGFTHVFVSQNPGGTWRPADANTDVGTYTPSGTYGKVSSIYASRICKFSIRYQF